MATTPLKTLTLRPSKAPNLPIAPAEYTQQYQDQLNNALRLYFNQIDNFSQPFTSNAGGGYLKFPSGAYQSLQTQTPSAINTPKLIVLDTVNYENGMYRVLGDGIHFQIPGRYNVQFSAQITNSDTQNHDVDIWLRQNGIDLANSASVATVLSTHGGQPGYFVLAANFFIEANINDYIEFWWSTNSTQVSLNYLPAITTPFTSPGAPSFIATVSFVSALY